ncbi:MULTISPECIES: hypothetical protein [Peribacillus]|uniref:hypothetical protein n=1 Tax=Peribacillus TaxID=2675229 RepID=UPI0024C1BFD6|nr:hypothetical protein [Peribacillus simplex]WHY58647.1 hypothetical protein QNH43_10505 [Peribacillus simplex]
MLLDKVISTRKLIEQVKIEEDRLSKYEDYREFSQKLVDQSSAYYEFINAIKSLEATYPEEFMKPDMSKVIEKINELLETFENDPKQNKINYLTKEIDNFNTEWHEKWTKFASSKSQDVIRGLSSIKQVAGLDTDINDIIHWLEVLTNKWPISERNLQQFTRYLIRAREKLTNINASPEVQKFLDSVANNKATINDVTPEIIRWLNENNFSSNLKITYK